MRLQPFTVGGDSFRENLEALVSYNVRNDGMHQDCLYIDQGHLMTTNYFHDLLDGSRTHTNL